MERHYFGLSTLLASVALLIWSIGETFAYPHGPNVSLGSNPIVTIDCGNANTSGTDVAGYPSYSNPYQVPFGYDYVITDISANTNESIPLQIDSGGGFQSFYYHLTPAQYQNGNPQIASMTTGIKIPAGYSVRCQSSSYGFMSGYLAHQ